MSPLVDPRRPSTKVPRVALLRPPLFLFRTKIRNFYGTMGCHRSVAAPPLLPLTPQSNALIAPRTSSGAHPCLRFLVGCCVDQKASADMTHGAQSSRSSRDNTKMRIDPSQLTSSILLISKSTAIACFCCRGSSFVLATEEPAEHMGVHLVALLVFGRWYKVHVEMYRGKWENFASIYYG